MVIIIFIDEWYKQYFGNRNRIKLWKIKTRKFLKTLVLKFQLHKNIGWLDKNNLIFVNIKLKLETRKPYDFEIVDGLETRNKKIGNLFVLLSIT